MKLPHQIKTSSTVCIAILVSLLCGVFAAYNVETSPTAKTALGFSGLVVFAMVYGISNLFLRTLRIANIRRVLLVGYYFFLINSCIAIIVYPLQGVDPGIRLLQMMAIAIVIPGGLAISSSLVRKYNTLSKENA